METYTDNTKLSNSEKQGLRFIYSSYKIKSGTVFGKSIMSEQINQCFIVYLFCQIKSVNALHNICTEQGDIYYVRSNQSVIYSISVLSEVMLDRIQ